MMLGFATVSLLWMCGQLVVSLIKNLNSVQKPERTFNREIPPKGN